MILGDFQFSLKTLSPNSLSRTTEYNWPDSERVGDLPFLQNLGISKDIVEIEGVFYPRFASDGGFSTNSTILNNAVDLIASQFGFDANSGGSYGSINDIRKSNLCKTSNNLINDNGEILGKFVITSIKETQSYFDKNGVTQKIEFTLTLKRTPELTESAIEGAGSIVDAITNLAKSYLRW